MHQRVGPISFAPWKLRLAQQSEILDLIVAIPIRKLPSPFSVGIFDKKWEYVKGAPLTLQLDVSEYAVSRNAPIQNATKEDSPNTAIEK